MEILLVEDNPGDVRLAIEALRTSRVENRINVAEDGEVAMSYLKRQGVYADAVRPDMILLDLNMPRLDGREVLSRIKNDPVLRQIPVVVLTVSQDEEDIARCYRDHANCYISKPIDFNQFIRVIKSIEHFWFAIVQLPPEERAFARPSLGA